MGKLEPRALWSFVPSTKIAIIKQKIDFWPQISKFWGQKSTFSPLAANLSPTDQCFQHEKGVRIVFWSGIRSNGPKMPIFGPKCQFWAKFGLFGPKIQFLGAGSKNFGTLISGFQ